MAAVIFDLDGTLVDSAALLRDVANSLLRELALRPMDEEEARSYIGNGAQVFLEKTLQARQALDPAHFEPLFQRYLQAYAAAPAEANNPMPGVTPALQALSAAGHRLAICTNKPSAPTAVLLEGLAWRRLFQAVICGDTLAQRKPHPAPLLAAAERLASPPAFYVGDSEIDAATAEAADLPFLLYAEGYRSRPIEELRHVAAFADFRELPGLIADLAEAKSPRGG